MAEAKEPSEDIIAEAAIWAALLRSDTRTLREEEQFRSWLNASHDRVVAFEIVTDAWELAGGVLLPQPQDVGAVRRWRPLPVLVSLAVLLGGVASWQLNDDPAFATAVGERREITLSDGSRVLMNTDTKLVEKFSEGRRTIVLERGEAAFDVVRDSLRPFVVQAGDSQVVALGTVFDVRWTEGSLAVTLAEGRVHVIDESGRAPGVEIALAPGQRLENQASATPVLRDVDLEVALAWRSGQVIFDEAPLAKAVEEMNRYTPLKIEIEGRSADRVKVSGVFKAGGSAEFARALRDLYGFGIRQAGNRLIIAPAPLSPRNPDSPQAQVG